MTVIPQFLLKRIYIRGSLRFVPEGVAFDIINAVGPGILTKINSIRVGGMEYLANQILLKLEDKLGPKLIQAAEISEQNPAVFLMNQTITCVLKGAQLESGNHTITVDLLSKEAGKVVISIQDQLAANPA